MCLSFVYYYPALELSQCLSVPSEYESLQVVEGIEFECVLAVVYYCVILLLLNNCVYFSSFHEFLLQHLLMSQRSTFSCKKEKRKKSSQVFSSADSRRTTPTSGLLFPLNSQACRLWRCFNSLTGRTKPWGRSIKTWSLRKTPTWRELVSWLMAQILWYAFVLFVCIQPKSHLQAKMRLILS